MSAACLLLHGFCGSPFEVAPLKEPLEALGLAVRMPRLPGHGTDFEDFQTTFFKDWYGTAERELLELKREHEQVLLVGFSMGGSISLQLAARHNPAGVVSLAAAVRALPVNPLEARSKILYFAPVLRFFKKELKVRTARPESRVIAPFEGYEGRLFLAQYNSLMKGLAATRPLLSSVTCPALVVADLHDRIVHPESSLYIASHVKSEDLTLHFTRMRERVTGHHLLATHRETRDTVRELVTGFARRVLGLGKDRQDCFAARVG